MPGSGGEPWPAWPEGFAASDRDRRAALVLATLRGLTAGRILSVSAGSPTASACVDLVLAGRLGSRNDQVQARGADADALEAAVAACGARFVTVDDPEYPTSLGHIHDPPLALFVRGGELPQGSAAVAVVGARRCSALGREVARSIGRGLAGAGVTVVSGAARGIDAAAHEGALDAEGPTVAVLGCGIDIAHPAASRELIHRIAARGALVSEYPPGTPPEPFRFPARNRIVAGLSSATVVVEGAQGSGSNITGEHAMEFGRDVYAVPGAVNNPLSQVPLALLRDGATPIRGVEDLLGDLGVDPSCTPARTLSLEDRALLQLLPGPTLPEHVARALGVEIPQAIARLMTLELRGLVRSVGGRYETTLVAVKTR